MCSCTAAAAAQFELREGYKLLLCRAESCCFPEEELLEQSSLLWALLLSPGWVSPRKSSETKEPGAFS